MLVALCKERKELMHRLLAIKSTPSLHQLSKSLKNQTEIPSPKNQTNPILRKIEGVRSEN
jgi:hypothetical protein